MRTAIFLVLVGLVLAQQKLNFAGDIDQSRTVDGLVGQFAELQPEVYRKVFQHYIVEKIAEWKQQGLPSGTIREQLLRLLTDAKGPLLANLSEFMQSKLFTRLGKAEINHRNGHPDSIPARRDQEPA